MADERKSGHCPHCETKRLFTRPGTSHILHLLLSVITMGLWLPIWLLSAIKIGGWRCTICGGVPKGLIH